VVRDAGDMCTIWYDGNSALLCGVYYRHKRPKLGVDPEAVMLKSGLESSTAAAFLHENMLEFVDHDAVEDAAGACSYLSDAGPLTSFCDACLLQLALALTCNRNYPQRLYTPRNFHVMTKCECRQCCQAIIACLSTAVIDVWLLAETTK
jgi:hypothetical protein